MFFELKQEMKRVFVKEENGKKPVFVVFVKIKDKRNIR